MQFQQLIGLKGVAADENPKARFCSQLLEFPMLMAALWVSSAWYLSSQGMTMHRAYDLAPWSLFVFETLLLTSLVNNKTLYLKTNWMNLVIIAMGLPLLWGLPSVGGALRLLRLLILLSLLKHVGSSLQQLLAGKRLGPTLAGSSIVVLMAGIFIAAIDPAIETVSDGIWWAWVTVTTVGYGDMVPTSQVGRLFGGLLMLVGIALISLITASIAAWFISDREKEIAVSEHEGIQRLKQLEKQLHRLESKLDRLLDDTRDPR